MLGANKILITQAGKLISQKGNIQLYERIAYKNGGNYYKVLTSFKDGAPFKQIIKNIDLSYKDCYKPDDYKYSFVRRNRGLNFISRNIRKIWIAVLEQKELNNKSGNAGAYITGKYTVAKNFKTGEMTTVVKAKAISQNTDYSKNALLFSSKTTKGGKINKEYGLVTAKVDDGISTDVTQRIYKKNDSNPYGTITLKSSHSKKAVIMSIKEYNPNIYYVNKSV